MATPEEWGPPLWRILHILAEQLGKQNIRQLIPDQRRAWVQLLKSATGAIPCVRCRNHFRAWRKSHSIEAFMTMEGELLRSSAREWVWGLHTEVNDERVVPNMPLEEVEAVYSTMPLGPQVEACFAALQKALQLRNLDAEAYHGFKTALFNLRRFI